MKIKVCGMTNNRNIREIALLHPDYMGFVFYGGSPRDITGKIGELELSAIPASIKKVAVLVDQPAGKAADTIKRYGFDAVQLHGDEEPAYCKNLMPVCEVIKAFRIDESLPENLDRYSGNCHLFLFDAKGRNRGGNGIKFNHDILKAYTLDTPFILSGGIGDNDLPYLKSIDFKQMAGIDLNSRFEISPGYKSLLSLKAFITKIRSDASVDRQ